MPSTWGLRRRQQDTPDAPDEDLDQLQERYAARLHELLRPPTDAPSPEGEEAGEGWPDGEGGQDGDVEARGAARAAARVPFRIPARPPILVAAADAADGAIAPRSGDVVTPDEPERAASDDRAEEAQPRHTAAPRAAARPRTRTAHPAAGGRRSPKQSKAARRAQPVACPYCAALLDPPPASSRRCTRCRKRIVVRRAGDRTVYLTEAAVPVFEAERRRAAAHGRYVRPRDRWLKLAAAAGAPDGKVRRLADALASEASVEAARTLYTAATDRAFRDARRDHRWEDAERIRREQAAVLYRLAGRPSPPPDDVLALYREGVAVRLRGLAEIVREAELRGASCCDTCRADDGLVSRIKVEQRAPRLPHPGCPAGLCRCRWTLVARDVAELRRLVRANPRP